MRFIFIPEFVSRNPEPGDRVSPLDALKFFRRNYTTRPAKNQPKTDDSLPPDQTSTLYHGIFTQLARFRVQKSDSLSDFTAGNARKSRL